jgi:hypothetical protein
MPISMMKTDISVFSTERRNPYMLLGRHTGLPLLELPKTSFFQKMSQGAIGVTNPSYMSAGLAT